MKKKKADSQSLRSEYAEAGQICRWYEQLTRTALSVYLPTAVALVGFVEGSSAEPHSKFLLCLGGLVVSLLLANTVLRQQAYYHAYLDRAKKIEGELGMLLYTKGEEAKMPTLSIPNKSAIAAAIGVFAIYFVAKAIMLVRLSGRGHR